MISRGKMMVKLAKAERKLAIEDNLKDKDVDDLSEKDFGSDISDIMDPTYYPENNMTASSNKPPNENDNDNLPDNTLSANFDEILETVPGDKNNKTKRNRSPSNPLLLPECKCRKKCGEKYNIILNRQEILNKYKALSFAERRLFLDKYLSQSVVSTKTAALNPHKRNKTVHYSLPNSNINEQPVEVCKIMFLHTLGSKTDGFITQHLKCKEKLGYVDITDKRGTPRGEQMKIISLIKEERIIQFIEKYNPVVSHYNLKHSPNRKYLPPELSIAYLHKEYNNTFDKEKISYENFRSVFKKQNIGFSAPSQDDCPSCSKYFQHSDDTHINAETHKDEQPTCSKNITSGNSCDDNGDILEAGDNLILHDENKCSNCIKYAQHKKRYTEARAAYKVDGETSWPATHNVYCVDMQKILILPKMPIKNSYFVSRLIVMNETFAAMHGKKNICVLWHEGIIGRNAPNVTSAYYNIILKADPIVKTFVFWADNCSAQNKNWVLLSMFATIVNFDWGPDQIILKYFEPGHSFMKCDSVHGRIGAVWKTKSEILDMQDLENVIRAADKSNEIMLLTFQDFKKFEDGCKARRKTDKFENIVPLLENIRQVEFRKGSRSMFFKENLSDGAYLETKFLKKKFNAVIPAENDADNGINARKLLKIKSELLPHMHPKKRIFWNNLKSNENAEDLCKFSAH